MNTSQQSAPPTSLRTGIILLTARDREKWWYYAIMAVIGAVVGGYVTYRLAKKGGKEGLEKKIGLYDLAGFTPGS